MQVARAAALVLLAVAVPAHAFSSLPLGTSVHDDITAVAKDAGWDASATEALQQAVREPDFQESELDPDGTDVDRVDATADYRAQHHCDRIPPAADAASFEATTAYIQQERTDALAKARAGEADAAVDALGRALHALQDCYSHSNVVDLPDQQPAYEDAVRRGGGAVPGLRLVSFQPGADDPEDPPGDDYSHRAFAKDDADKNDESRTILAGNETKFDAAKSLARLAAVAFLQEFTQELSAGQRATLMQASEEDQGLPDDVNVPGPPAAVAVAALAFAAAVARRRR